MASFSRRDNVLVEYISRQSLDSPKPPSKSLDVDFHDVFGGPPRRSSIQDWRSSGSLGEEETVFSRDPWSGLSEKPVFGGEGSSSSNSRRKHPSDDFFDDIFRGDESTGSTPRKLSGRDPFSSSPSSRVSSPSRSLLIQSESFRGSSLSLPPVLSLPVKPSKEMDSSAFSPQSRNPRKNKETALISFASSTGASTSRFSNQAIQGQEGLKNDSRTFYRQSTLSREVSLNSDGSAQASKSDIQESEDHCNEDLRSSEVAYDTTQFHFSIYKWASVVVPIEMPLREGNASSSKESSKMHNIVNGHAPSDLLGAEHSLGNHNTLVENDSFQAPQPALSNRSDLIKSTEVVAEVVSKKQPKPRSNFQIIFKKVQGNLMTQNGGNDPKTGSGASDIDIGTSGGFIEKKKPVSKKEVPKSEEPLYCLLKENKHGSGASGPDNHSTGNIEKTPLPKNELPKPEETLYCLLKEIKNDAGASGADTDERMPVSKKEKKAKKQTAKRNILNRSKATSLQNAPVSADNKPVNNSVKGKIEDFVKILNEEAPSKSLKGAGTRDQGSTGTDTGAGTADNQANVRATKADQKNNKTLRDIPSKVDSSSEQFVKPQREIKTAEQIFDFQRNNRSATRSETIRESHKTAGNIEESCEDLDCTVEELPQADHNNQPQAGQNNEEIQASDAKIRKWSNGKEGNIRSLLSTLQYVLWPESGWKPVPLMDIIEGSSVRRSYQKALLCLHPDKLQQKGAAPHQKYIAEKVFDILQDAWTHFNSLGSF